MKSNLTADPLTIHKYVPGPKGNFVGSFLCRSAVKKVDLATNTAALVTCSKCLKMMIMYARAA